MFIRFMLLIVVISSLHLEFHNSSAQAECDPVSIRDEVLASLDAVETLEELQSINTQFDIALAECQGLYFSGTGKAAFDPVELDGVYLLSVNVVGDDGHAGVKFVPLSAPDDYEYDTYNVGEESAVLTFEAGRYIIEGSGYGIDSWEFWLERQE